MSHIPYLSQVILVEMALTRVFTAVTQPLCLLPHPASTLLPKRNLTVDICARVQLVYQQHQRKQTWQKEQLRVASE